MTPEPIDTRVKTTDFGNTNADGTEGSETQNEEQKRPRPKPQANISATNQTESTLSVAKVTETILAADNL